MGELAALSDLKADQLQGLAYLLRDANGLAIAIFGVDLSVAMNHAARVNQQWAYECQGIRR